ncbi:MAG: gliding motility-associated C-terminal domain-containing protein [Bacteroidia bacterium]|nr:gliding motility-associated C-terminal domain-containing protein [Bacteroidia bacterium]
MQRFKHIFLLLLFYFIGKQELYAQQKDITPSNDLYEWVENKGQWHPDIYFRCRQHSLDLQLGKDFLRYYFFDKEQLDRLHQHGPVKAKALPQDSMLNVYALSYQFLNTQLAQPHIEKPKNYYYNYYLGNNPSQWAHKARVSNHVSLQNLYPGIELKILSPNNSLKYEFWLEPNADINQIKYEIQGANRVYTEYGDLFIETPQGVIKEQKPYAYQIIENKRIEVEVNFKVQKNIVSFSSTSIQKNYPLIIDPSIVFLTYSGSTQDNFGCSATPGENGTLYAAGITTGDPSSAGKYPVTSNAFQLNYGGGGVAEGEALGFFPCDITFSKYSSDGKTLLYATYLGGSNNEVPHSMIVDDQENLILMGNTYSANFPTTANAYDNTHNGRHDIILSKFDKNGLIVGSTFIGGSGNDGINTNNVTQYFFADSYRGDVITDSVGNIYVASFTQSTDFPTTPGCIQTDLLGAQDGAIFKINPGLSQLLWSTYLGGNGVDAFYSIDLDNDQNIFLSGGTNSTDIQGTNGTQNPAFIGGSADGLIMEIDNNGQNIIRATYYGTDNYDQIISLERDKDNLIYVVGQSKGNMPVSAGVYSNPNAHQFITCLQPDLKTTVWSTVFGSGRNQIDLTINAFLVDECKRIYVSSWGGITATKTDNTSSSTIGIPTTPDAFQKSTDGSDFYLLLLNKNASNLLYATFIGGDNPDNSGDHVDGGTSRFDKRGVVYQSMCASCPTNNVPFSDLKTTPGVFAPTNVSPRCSNAALKFDFRIENAGFEWSADTCASIFSFKNTTLNASNFFWTFPNGELSYDENPTIQIPREYYGDTIRLIVEYGTNCADTAYGFVILPDSIETPIVPNVFTPNNDGLNDYFRIEGVYEQCNKTSVYIYNRWGQLYFEDEVSYFKWDGKSKEGIDAPEGVYYFILRTENNISGKKRDIHGTLTLIR